MQMRIFQPKMNWLQLGCDMRNSLPLTALRAFEAAARHRSFAVAAAELGLTATAISHQIRALETLCGNPLFRRRPRPVALTEAGARLFPVIRDGLDSFAAALAALSEEANSRPLRVTATNAFAGHWLVPRLPLWRDAHPEATLEIIGTDAVINLHAGDADVAIRYARTPPPDLVADELVRDRFWPICNPRLLVDGTPIRGPADLLRYPLIHVWWSDEDSAAPTWPRWLAAASGVTPDRAAAAASSGLSFREELHGIDAIIAGQGIGILSDVLVERELARGTLVKAFDFSLAGFGCYLARTANHPRAAVIEAFGTWLRSIARDAVVTDAI
jgi:LysR family transcriptional regulator, glycine cleavage system transcriptional activator